VSQKQRHDQMCWPVSCSDHVRGGRIEICAATKKGKSAHEKTTTGGGHALAVLFAFGACRVSNNNKRARRLSVVILHLPSSLSSPKAA
jgi:hypothetical protein